MAKHVLALAGSLLIAAAPVTTQTLAQTPAQPPAQPAPAPPPAVQLAPTPPALPDKMPFDIPYGMSITLDRAKQLIAAAEAEAKKHDWKMNIAVVDTHGELIAFAHMDNAQYPSIMISQNKARTAARWRRETRVFYKSYDSGKSYLGTLDPQLAASPGGIPLVENGNIIGAIGVSGGTGDQDEVVSKAGSAALK